MARNKPAKKARKKAAAKPAARKLGKKTTKAARKGSARTAARKPKKAVKKKAVKKSAPRRAATPARRPAAKVAKPARRPAANARPKPRLIAAVTSRARTAVAAGMKTALASTSATAPANKPAKKPNLDRPRKTVADVHGIPSSLDLNRTASAAKSGRAEMQDRQSRNSSSSPALTAGDVDADWQSAEAVGDEAPGGDNPTPDQDVVEEIGRALGVEYADDEELQGGDEIVERDRHRWELDPSSKDDFGDEE